MQYKPSPPVSQSLALSSPRYQPERTTAMDYFTYSRHATESAAYWAIEDYFAIGEIFDCDRPRVVREGNSWAVQILDGLYSY
jgi:hypothetical protein